MLFDLDLIRKVYDALPERIRAKSCTRQATDTQ